MKPLLIILGLIVTCFFKANGQITMVLRNGDYVMCKRFEIVTNPDQVMLEMEGKVVCYPVEKVMGYFKKSKDPFMYLMASGSPDDDGLTFDFMVRKLDGEINVGDHSVAGTPGSYSPGPPGGGGGHMVVGSSGSTLLYAEKGDMYATVYEPYSPPLRTINVDPKVYTKKNAIKRIRAMTSDLPGFDLAADSLTKDWDDERVVALIKRYNLAKHKPAQSSAPPSSVVNFYLKPTAKATSLKVIVDDTKEFELTIKKTATVLIPDNEVVKVCLVSAVATECILLRGTRCCKRYYQVIQNDEKGKLEMEVSDEAEAERYISKWRGK